MNPRKSSLFLFLVPKKQSIKVVKPSSVSPLLVKGKAYVLFSSKSGNRELKHQTFLTTRTAEKPRKTGSRPSFLARNRKVKQSTFLRHGLLPVLTSSLKDARDMTLISRSQGLITDEELLLLLEENTSRNPDFSYDAYDRFDLENMEEAECKSEFRVEKRDIPLLEEALGLPDTFAQKYFKFEKD